jgi:hypothetical protein
MKLWHKLVRIDGGKAIYSDEKGWQFHVPCNEATSHLCATEWRPKTTKGCPAAANHPQCPDPSVIG